MKNGLNILVFLVMYRIYISIFSKHNYETHLNQNKQKKKTRYLLVTKTGWQLQLFRFTSDVFVLNNNYLIVRNNKTKY